MPDKKEYRVFLSFAVEEKPLADALQGIINETFEGVATYNCTDLTHVSTTWLDEVKDAMKGADVVVSLLSPDSIKKQWIMFEYGAAWFGSGDKTLIPIFHSGINASHLPRPMDAIQGVDLNDASFGSVFLEKLRDRLGKQQRRNWEADEVKARIAPALNAIGKKRETYSAFVAMPMSDRAWLPRDLSAKGRFQIFPAETQPYRDRLLRQVREAVKKINENNNKVYFGWTDPDAPFMGQVGVEDSIEALKNSAQLLLIYPGPLASGSLCELGFAAARGLKITAFVRTHEKGAETPPSFLAAIGARIVAFGSPEELKLALLKYFKVPAEQPA